MRTCSYCGRENDEAQEICSGCASPLVQKPISREERAIIPIGLGCALQTLGRPLCNVLNNAHATLLGNGLMLLGTVIVVWAAMRYAAMKGYPRWLGGLGLLSCLGLVILFVLPDRRKQAETQGINESPEPGTG